MNCCDMAALSSHNNTRESVGAGEGTRPRRSLSQSLSYLQNSGSNLKGKLAHSEGGRIIFQVQGKRHLDPEFGQNTGVDVLTNVGSDVKIELWLNRADEKYYFFTRVYSLGVKPGPV